MGVGLDEAGHDKSGLYVRLAAGRAPPDIRNRAAVYFDKVRAIRVRLFTIEQRISANPQLSQRFPRS